jgi:hypothetical protein
MFSRTGLFSYPSAHSGIALMNNLSSGALARSTAVWGVLAVLTLAVAPRPALAEQTDSIPATSAVESATSLTTPLTCAPQPVFAFDFLNVVGDRTRMIQIALVAMALGIAFLMWNKGK